MKRLLFLIAVAALASCSDIANDVDGGVTTPSDNATQVSFTASISSETRVAGDPEYFEDNDNIMVCAFTPAGTTNYTVFDASNTYTYADGSFTSLEPITREDAFQELTYLAVYPAASFTLLSGSNFEFTVKTDQSVEGNLELSDLLIATVFESTETTPALTFDHALSCLTITFEGKDGEDLVGLYGLDEAALTVTANATTYVNMYNNNLDYDAMGPVENLTAAYIGESSFKVFFAPQTIKEGTKLATITFGNKTFTWEAKNDITFESGERYNYTWKIDTEDMAVTGTTYDVTFSSNGATYDTQMVAENGTATAPETDPTTADATFIGWYVTPAEGELTEIYDFTTEVTKDITLTAKYFSHTAESFDIYNVTELCTFRDLVNDGTATSVDITLMDGLDLSTVCYYVDGTQTNTGVGTQSNDVNWTTIGVSTDYPYTGTFDGNYKTIEGLYVNGGGGASAGFFSYLAGGAVIKNLTIKDIYVSGSTGAGAIACTISGSGLVTIENCETNGGTIYASNQAGGILGNSAITTSNTDSRVLIKNCRNIGTKVIAGNNYGGGIIARLQGDDTNDYVSQVINCYNTGTVTRGSGSNSYYFGGIAGDASKGAQIIGCYNSGSITAYAYVGGIVGTGGMATSGCVVAACYNIGTITVSAGSYNYGVGGIMGRDVKASTITSCYNTGTITSTKTYVGGILGYNVNTGTTLTENYYIGDTTYGVGNASADVDGATKLTDLTGLNGVLSIMNTACEDSGYEFVEGDDNPTLQEITTTSDNTDNDSVDAD